MGTHNLRVSALTVRRRLQERGTSSHKTDRGNVESVALIGFDSVSDGHNSVGVVNLFTDESLFCVEMFDRRRKVWRRRGEQFQDCYVKQVSRWDGGSVMV